MTALPAKAELDGTSGGHNQGVFKAAIGGVRDYLAGLFGATGDVSGALAGLKLIDPEAQLNLAPSFAVSSNALTATVKDAANANLGAGNPAFLAQRSATLTDGAVTLRQIAANVALTVSAGSTLGLASATPGWLHWYLIDNAGAQELAVSGSFFGFTGRISTTQEGGAGAADSGTVMYSATARSNVAFRWIAASKGQHTSGNWTALPTEIRRGPSLPVDELLEDATPDIAADFLLIWDASTGTLRKVRPSLLSSLNTTRIDVASAATVNLTSSAPSTRHINITGSIAITGFTVAAGLCYFVRFAGSPTLTNNASIVTQTGANIVTQAGDTCILRATAANTVEVVSYVPAVLNQQATRSMVRLHSLNGYGSTNNKIRRFTTVVTNQGTDVTYADSATLGATFTINASGVYAISYSDNFSSASEMGISLNSAQLTTSFLSITDADRLAIATTAGAAFTALVAWVGYLASGSVIRAHTTGVGASLGNLGNFTITRVG